MYMCKELQSSPGISQLCIYIHIWLGTHIYGYIYIRIFMTQYTISYIFALYTYIWYPPKTYLSSKVGGTYSVPFHLSLSTSDQRFKFQDPKKKLLESKGVGFKIEDSILHIYPMPETPVIPINISQHQELQKVRQLTI